MMNTTTKAAILVRQNSPLTVATIRLPKLGVGQVLIKIEASGICGKQVDEISGKQGSDPYLPHLLGHEGAGVVLDTGLGVRKVKEGDHVVLHWMKSSGIDSAPPKFSWKGKPLNAGWVTTFSEYTIASENRMTVIPTDLNFEIAALFGCAVTTGFGIVFNNANLKPGQSIAVFGAGGVGLNVIQAASLVTAHPIVAIDKFASKLEDAMCFGGTHKIDASNENVLKCLLELSDGRGFDAVVDTTGNNAARETAFSATAKNGTTVLAGVPHVQDRMTIDSFSLHFGKRLIGSHGGNTNPDLDIPRYVQLYLQKKLKLDEQISHRFHLDDINEAIAQVQNGNAKKCIVLMTSRQNKNNGVRSSQKSKLQNAYSK